MYEEQTRPYGSPQTARVSHHIFKHGSPRLVIFAAIAGLLGIAVSVASLTFMLQYRSTAQAQIRQLRQAVASAQAAGQGNASSIAGLSGKVATIGGALSALAPFSMVCSQYLTGPGGGPTTFYSPCTDQKP